MTTKMTACWSSPRRTFRYKRRDLIEKDECVGRNGKWKKKRAWCKKRNASRPGHGSLYRVNHFCLNLQNFCSFKDQEIIPFLGDFGIGLTGIEEPTLMRRSVPLGMGPLAPVGQGCENNGVILAQGPTTHLNYRRIPVHVSPQKPHLGFLLSPMPQLSAFSEDRVH